MFFKKQVESTADIKGCYQRGLQALGNNSQKIKVSEKSKLTGSVNLDKCTSSKYPNDPRWDYIIGYKEVCYFIELHPASTKNIKEVIKKLDWLKGWLINEGKAIDKIKSKKSPYRWIATGGVAILKNSPQARGLAKSGVTYPQGIARLE